MKYDHSGTAVVQNYFYTVDRFFPAQQFFFRLSEKSRFKKSATTRTATIYFRQQLTRKRVEIKFTCVFFRLSGGVSIYSATVCAYTLADGPDSFAKTRIHVRRGSRGSRPFTYAGRSLFPRTVNE